MQYKCCSKKTFSYNNIADFTVNHNFKVGTIYGNNITQFLGTLLQKVL